MVLAGCCYRRFPSDTSLGDTYGERPRARHPDRRKSARTCLSGDLSANPPAAVRAHGAELHLPGTRPGERGARARICGRLSFPRAFQGISPVLTLPSSPPPPQRSPGCKCPQPLAGEAGGGPTPVLSWVCPRLPPPVPSSVHRWFRGGRRSGRQAPGPRPGLPRCPAEQACPGLVARLAGWGRL